MREVKQSTARNLMVLMVDSTDHVTGKTGLTLTITASKAGAAFASITPTVTERGNGWYSLALTTAHLDTLGDFALHITGTAADPADLLATVVAYNPEDAAGLGLSRIDAAISSRSTYAGTAVASVTGSVGSVAGDVAGKILGGGAGSMTAAGVRAVDASGNTIAPASQLTTHDSDIKGRLPTTLVSGRIDASVGAVAAGAITSSAIAAGAIGATQAPNLDAAISTRALEAGGNLATILGRIIGTIAAGTHNPQSGDSYSRLGAPTLASIAADIQARLSSSAYTAPDNTSIGTILGRIIGTLAAGTHNPQTGDSYARIGATGSGLTSLASAASLSTTDGKATAIKAKTDNLPTDPADESLLEAAISTRLADASYVAPDNAGITAIKAKTDNLPASPAAVGSEMSLESAAIDAILDDPVEGTVTLRQAFRVMLSVLAGKASGSPTGPIVYRDIGDTKDRVTGAIDADGNRTSVTIDAV